MRFVFDRSVLIKMYFQSLIKEIKFFTLLLLFFITIHTIAGPGLKDMYTCTHAENLNLKWPLSRYQVPMDWATATPLLIPSVFTFYRYERKGLLNHVVFPRQTGHKKKLNTFISFPEQLDMGPFLEGKPGISSTNLCDTQTHTFCTFP